MEGVNFLFGNVHLFFELADDRFLRWILDNVIAIAGDFDFEEKERLAMGHIGGEEDTDEGAGIIVEGVGGETVVDSIGGELAVDGVGGELAVDGVGGELAVDGGGGELAVHGVGGELAVHGGEGELAVGGVGVELAVDGGGGELAVDGVGGELAVHKESGWAAMSVHFVVVAVLGSSKAGEMTRISDDFIAVHCDDKLFTLGVSLRDKLSTVFDSKTVLS